MWTLENLATQFNFPLQWCHNERYRVPNHGHLHCSLNCWFRRRPKKTPKLRITGICVGNSPVTGKFPHKWPVAWKMFPFDDFIMLGITMWYIASNYPVLRWEPDRLHNVWWLCLGPHMWHFYWCRCEMWMGKHCDLLKITRPPSRYKEFWSMSHRNR